MRNCTDIRVPSDRGSNKLDVMSYNVRGERAADEAQEAKRASPRF